MSKLATNIVREHFDPIIGKAQNDYMISKFHTPVSIADALYHGYRYYFVKDGDHIVGFTAFLKKDDEMYLSKFYLKKEDRGQRLFPLHAPLCSTECRKPESAQHNSASKQRKSVVQAYKKIGFNIVREDKADIGEGFFLDDYIMEFRI